jgi:general secretion pathway protein I
MRQRGFTLLEVMVALAVLSIALVALFSQQAASIKQGNEARVITKATFLAQERMAEVLTRQQLRAGEEQGETQDSVPAFQWKTAVEETDVEGMQKITVIVLWKEGGQGRDLRFVTYVAAQK